jgi:hypothetical protein
MNSQPNGPPQGNPQEFYQQYSKISPEMLNFGLSAGQDMLNRQKAKWMPGVSDFWTSLKIYFAVRFRGMDCSTIPALRFDVPTILLYLCPQVNNGYVLKKLLILIYPGSNKFWGRTGADETGSYGDVSLGNWNLFS